MANILFQFSANFWPNNFSPLCQWQAFPHTHTYTLAKFRGKWSKSIRRKPSALKMLCGHVKNIRQVQSNGEPKVIVINLLEPLKPKMKMKLILKLDGQQKLSNWCLHKIPIPGLLALIRQSLFGFLFLAENQIETIWGLVPWNTKSKSCGCSLAKTECTGR